MLGQDSLDLGRVDVVSAADVHLALAPDEREVAALVEEPGIAGAEPAVGVEHPGGLFRIAPIAAHHRARAAAHATDHARGTGATVVVDDLELDVDAGPPDRSRHHLRCVAGNRARRDRGLGARVADHDRAPEPRFHLAHEIGRHRRRARARDTQRRKIGRVEVGMIEHEPPLRRHSLPDRDPLARHQFDRLAGFPRCRRDHRRDDLLDLLPRARHVRHVRERKRREADVEGLHPSRPRRPRRRAKLSWSKNAPFGIPVVPLVHTIATTSSGSGTGRSRGPTRAYAAAHRTEIVGPHDHSRGGALENALDFARPEARVDARRDRAQAHHSLVTDGVVERRREDQRDDVAAADAGRREVRGEAVGRPIPLRERDPAARLHVGGPPGMSTRRGAEQINGCSRHER